MGIRDVPGKYWGFYFVLAQREAKGGRGVGEGGEDMKGEWGTLVIKRRNGRHIRMMKGREKNSGERNEMKMDKKMCPLSLAHPSCFYSSSYSFVFSVSTFPCYSSYSSSISIVTGTYLPLLPLPSIPPSPPHLPSTPPLSTLPPSPPPIHLCFHLH